MTEMADLGVFQRKRQGIGRYLYTLAEAYRPRWPSKEKCQQNQYVSTTEHRVSHAETQKVNLPNLTAS